MKKENDKKVSFPSLSDKANAVGYKDIEDYFSLNWDKNYSDMAKERETTYQRVSKEYKKFLEKHRHID